MRARRCATVLKSWRGSYSLVTNRRARARRLISRTLKAIWRNKLILPSAGYAHPLDMSHSRRRTRHADALGRRRKCCIAWAGVRSSRTRLPHRRRAHHRSSAPSTSSSATKPKRLRRRCDSRVGERGRGIRHADRAARYGRRRDVGARRAAKTPTLRCWFCPAMCRLFAPKRSARSYISTARIAGAARPVR